MCVCLIRVVGEGKRGGGCIIKTRTQDEIWGCVDGRTRLHIEGEGVIRDMGGKYIFVYINESLF